MGGAAGRARVRPGTVVYASAQGSNVLDVDANRFVDLAAGFGAMLLGHSHPAILRAIELQAPRLLQALGDVHPSEPKIALAGRLAALSGDPTAQVVFGQSGADAVTAALKSAVLATGKPGVVAFDGAYHGMSYAPLASCGLRASYRAPFGRQLNPRAPFVPWPVGDEDTDEVLERLRFELAQGDVGAVLVEPIQGRAGVRLPPAGFLEAVAEMTHDAGALVVADEIWTGLGRTGEWLYGSSAGLAADIVCLGKGLGGGLPISACVGRRDVMRGWAREEEVVDTSTFAGAPLACTAALATLDTLTRQHLVERAASIGAAWLVELARAIERFDFVHVRGAGLMVAVDLGPRPAAGARLAQLLLERGFITSAGGGERTSLVLTPPLTIDDALLSEFTAALVSALEALDG